MPRRKAVLVDVDGTLTNVSSIRHHVIVTADHPAKDFDAFHQASGDCPPHEQALDYCRRHYEAGHVVVVVTARMERHYDVTKAWLDRWMPVPYDGPIMREDGLRHSDVSVKRRIYNYLSRHYEIVACCDDNPAILELWDELGIPEIEIVPGWED
jgi:hypothetical protein